VDYLEGGVLSYRELLVALPIRHGAVPRVHITDIWVSSEQSRAGGRSLWAIPKELADLHVEDRRTGPFAHTSWSASKDGTPIAAAAFTGATGMPLRTPFSFSTAQQREDGSDVLARVTGRARTLPCLGSWRFGTDGPLAWLSGRTPLLSFRMTGFDLAFGI
jgi:acetoacetate decarboxylase